MAEGEPHSPEALRGEGIWTAEHLRYYLLAMAFNTWEQDFCLAQRDFPRQIHLSTAWHETFGAMRQATARDGYERWGLIGVTADRRKVVMSQPQVFVDGGRDVVEAEDKLHAMMHAAQKGIPFVVGTFHSHPSFGMHAFRAFNLTIGAENTFSVMDFHNGIAYRADPATHIVVGPTEIRLFCRSRESAFVPADVTAPAFEQFWFRYYLAHGLSMEAVNRAIAKRHRLVMYKGKPNQPLARIFPT